MGSPNQQAVEVSSNDEFDSITLDASGSDVLALGQDIADKLAAKDDTNAKAKAEAEAKAKVDAEAKAKEEAEAKAKIDAEALAAAAASGRKDEKVDGVLAKDGKNVIPFAVLEAERERTKTEKEARQAAEKAATEARAELERLKSGAVTDPSKAEAMVKALKEKIAGLEDTVPEIAETLKPIVAMVESLSAAVDDTRASAGRRDVEAKAEAERAVQEAIDRNPKLTYLQAKDPEMWNRVADADAMLRADPKMAALDFDKRFAKALAAVEAVHGDITLPAEFQPRKEETAAEKAAKEKADAEAKVKAAKDAKERAEAELKKAGEQQRPVTLSDLPGGTTPDTDDRTADKLSMGEIETQVDSFLAKGGRIQDIPGLFRVAG